MTAAPSATAHQHRGLATLLAALSAIGPFSTDAYLPSLPEIGRIFNVTPVVVQQTLTAYMVPFAAMTLWHGAISDSLGRRRVTLGALVMFFLASVGCALSWNIESLMLFRGLQGMTAGAGMVIGRAIVRDVLHGAEAQRLMARIALVFAIAPAVGPVLGGWLHVWFGWRSVFVFLALFTAGVWFWCWRALPETLHHEHRQSLALGHLARSYWLVLRTVPFMALTVAVTLNFAAVFLYIVSAPAFLLNHLHVGDTGYLWLFGPITLGIIVGSALSSRTAGRLTPGRTVALGYGIMATAAGANLLFHLFVPPCLPWSVLPIFVYVGGSGLAMPSLTLMALDLFPRQRGLAASCQGFIQSAGNAAITAVVAPLAWGSALSLAAGQAVILSLGLGTFFLCSGIHSPSLGVDKPGGVVQPRR